MLVVDRWNPKLNVPLHSFRTFIKSDSASTTVSQAVYKREL